MKNKVQSGIGVVLSIDEIPVAGQENASLNRSMNAIDITNKINSEWQESLAGVKTWSIHCGGIYVKNSKGFNDLEKAFMDNKEITVEVILDDQSYKGKALIIDFPLHTVFNTQFKYSLKLLGVGELIKIRE